MKRNGLILAVVAVGALTLSACSSSSSSSGSSGSSGSSSTYGPSFGKFTATFPSTPQTATDTKEVLSGFPTGVTSGTAYWVSPIADPLKSSTKTPPAPTYLVVVGKAKSAAQAATFTSSIKQAPGSKPITVNGATGYTFSSSEKNLGQNQATDPTATESITFVTKGTIMYAVIVVAKTAAAAQQFQSSFKPA
jgi:hypothetical protein